MQKIKIGRGCNEKGRRKCAFKILTGKPTGRSPLGRLSVCEGRY